VRKLLEQQDAKRQYQFLTFHCDWAVHPELEGATAQEILKQFDAASVHLKTGIQLYELPQPLQGEVDNISQMRYFKRELNEFLRVNGLPSYRGDWSQFVHLYASVVEDCPLVIKAQNQSSTIMSVTLKMELARSQPYDGQSLFQLRWMIKDKADKMGENCIIFSFHAWHVGRPPMLLL
jgi:hypothetical protein